MKQMLGLLLFSLVLASCTSMPTQRLVQVPCPTIPNQVADLPSPPPSNFRQRLEQALSPSGRNAISSPTPTAQPTTGSSD